MGCEVFRYSYVEVGRSAHFFFFQAEDGIRDYKVTGVQTCALPICRRYLESADRPHDALRRAAAPVYRRKRRSVDGVPALDRSAAARDLPLLRHQTQRRRLDAAVEIRHELGPQFAARLAGVESRRRTLGGLFERRPNGAD